MTRTSEVSKGVNVDGIPLMANFSDSFGGEEGYSPLGSPENPNPPTKPTMGLWGSAKVFIADSEHPVVTGVISPPGGWGRGGISL